LLHESNNNNRDYDYDYDNNYEAVVYEGSRVRVSQQAASIAAGCTEG